MQRDRLPERLDDGHGLLLRRLLVADAEALAVTVAESLEHLRPWMPWAARELLSLPARRALLREWERDWAGGGDVVLGVFTEGRLIGSSGLHRRIGPDGLEIGYWLHPGFLGRGLATRLAVVLTAAALAQPGITHVEIHTDRANHASAAVAARAGFAMRAQEPRPPQAPKESGIEQRWRITSSKR